MILDKNKLFGIHQTSFLPIEALEFSELKIDTEYDRAKAPPYNGNNPRPPLVV